MGQSKANLRWLELEGYGRDLLAKDQDPDPLRDRAEFRRLLEAPSALPAGCGVPARRQVRGGRRCPSNPQKRPKAGPRSAPFPDRPTLAAGLGAALGGPVTLLRRKRNDYSSTFPSEVVTCRLADGSERRLFCKYSAGVGHNAHGHRGGVAYEAEVYRRVLQPSRLSSPRFYGTYADGPARGTWLIIEYLAAAEVVHLSVDPAAMRLAARWVGRFHAAQEARLARTPAAFLRTYDAAYYRGWVRRTSLFAGRWHRRFPWLAVLCERLEEFLPPLLERPATVIHGEYYAPNILLQGGGHLPRGLGISRPRPRGNRPGHAHRGVASGNRSRV
jgi:hypothetical protein